MHNQVYLYMQLDDYPQFSLKKINRILFDLNYLIISMYKVLC